MGRKTHGPYFIAAIEYDDLEKVQEILAQHVRGKEKVREFVCNPVRRLASEFSEVPLMLAAALPTPSIIRYFCIKHEVPINYVYKEQVGPKKLKAKTALITAVRRGHYDTVDGILALSCDPNLQDHKGRTALHHAVRKADYRMAKMLLVRGAQVNTLDAAENSPLHIASIFGHLELVKLLLQYQGDLYQKGQHGAVPMHIASREGHAALVRLYSNYEVNVNTRVPCYDERDKAPLHVACEQGHSETALALLEYCGADVNITDSEGETALHCAVINTYDNLGMKSKDDYAETVKILVRYGVDVNRQNARGETALLLAARNEFQKIVDLLVVAGTDPLIEDNDGNKAIDLVVKEDTVSRQTLKQAMEQRERIMSEAMELRAKGFSTSMKNLPLRSQSALNMAAALGGNSMSRAASNPGLFSSQHQLALALHQQPTLYEDDYLPPVSARHNHTADSQNQSQSHSSSSGSQGRGPPGPGANTYAEIDPARKMSVQEGVTMGRPPMMMKRAKSEDSLSSPQVQRKVQGRALPAPPHKKPMLETRDSIMSRQSEATSMWQVTPRTSTSSAFPVNYQEEMPYESLPSEKMDKKGPPAAKPLQFLAPGQAPVAESDEDTYFDDESFDTLDDLDDNAGQKPAIAPKPKPKRNKPPEPTQAEIESHKKAMAQNDPNLQNWLTEQAVLLKEREQHAHVGPIAHSTPPTLKKNLQTFQPPPSPPPPRPERNFSSSSTDTVKSKPPPLEPKANTKVTMNKTDKGQTIITMRPRRDDDATTTATDSSYTTDTTTENVYTAHGRPISDSSESTMVSDISSVSQRREKNNNEPPKVRPRAVPRGRGLQPPNAPPPLPPKAAPEPDDDGSSTDDSSSSYSESDSDASTEINVAPKVPPKQIQMQKQAPPTPEKHKARPKTAAKPVVEAPKPKAKSPATPKKYQQPAPPPKKNQRNSASPDVSFSSGDEDESDAKPKPPQTIKIQAVPVKQKPQPIPVNQQHVPPPQQKSPLTQQNVQTVYTQQQQPPPEEDSVALEYKFFKTNKEIITSTGSDIQASVERKMVYNQQVAAQQQQQMDQQRQQEQAMLDQREAERKAQQERLQQQEIERVRMIQQQAEKNRQERLAAEEQKRQQAAAMQAAMPQEPAVQQRPAYTQQPVVDTSPVHNGHTPSDEDDKQAKRKSVTIGQDTIIPTTPRKPKDHDHRRVMYDGAMPIGYSIVGGNAEGVFVHQLDAAAEAKQHGLAEGDEILRVDAMSTKGKTREEVTLKLINTKTVITLIVRTKMDRYQAILSSGGAGDSFHVRTRFSLDVKGEVQIDDGDIFLVRDTMPHGRMGFWQASKVSGRHMADQHGLIPNDQRAEQIALAHRLQQSRPVEQVQRGGFLRRSFGKGGKRSRSKSVDRLNGPGDTDEVAAIAPGDIVPYERIEQRSSEQLRPVFLLGLFCDSVKDMLVQEAPDIFECPVGDIEVEPGRSSRDPVNTRPIKGVMARDKHCVTILSPKAIQFIQEKTDLFPIVLYLAPGSKQIVKIMKGRLAPGFERKPGYMYEEAHTFAKAHNKLFTASVTYTLDDTWYLTLKDTIDGVQRTPFWMPARPPQQLDEEEGDVPTALPSQGAPAPLKAVPAPRQSRQSRTTDDIPDEVQQLLRHHTTPPGKSPAGDGYVPLDQVSPARRPANLGIQQPTTPTDEHMYLPMNKQHSTASVNSQSNTLNGSQNHGNPRSILKNSMNSLNKQDADTASQSSDQSGSYSSKGSMPPGPAPLPTGVQGQMQPRQPEPLQRQIPQAAISTRHQAPPVAQQQQQPPYQQQQGMRQPLQRQNSGSGPPAQRPPNGAPQQVPLQRPMRMQRPPMHGQAMGGPPRVPQQRYQGPPRQMGPGQHQQRYRGPGPRPGMPPGGETYQNLPPAGSQPHPGGMPGQRMVFRPASPQHMQQHPPQHQDMQRAQMAAHPGYQQAGAQPVLNRQPSTGPGQPVLNRQPSSGGVQQPVMSRHPSTGSAHHQPVMSRHPSTGSAHHQPVMSRPPSTGNAQPVLSRQPSSSGAAKDSHKETTL